MNAGIARVNVHFGLLALLFICSSAAAAFTGLYILSAFPFAVLLFIAGWHQGKLFFYLLLFSLPFSFEYRFSSSLGTDFPDELLMLFVSFLFLAAWLHTPRLIPAVTLQHPLLLLFAVSLIWAAITVCFSTNPLLSLKFFLAKTWYAGAFILAPLIILKNKKNILIAVTVFTISLLLVTTIVLFRHYFTGFSFATINNAVFPFFRNHVNYSSMLVCFIPVLFAFLHLSEKSIYKKLFVCVIAILLTGLLFSYARGAWLALITGASAWWLIKRKWFLTAYVCGIVITLVSLFWIKSNDRYLLYAHDSKTTIFHKNFSEHLVATYKLKDVSTAERFYRWIAGVRMIKDNWLTGYGPNTFYENYKSYTVPAYKTWVSNNDDHSTVHNYFLLTAIEQGIPGLLLLLILLGAMFFYSQYLYHRIKDKFYKTAVITAGVILCMIITVNFLSDLIETDKIGSLFFLCLSLLIAIDINTKTEVSNSSSHIQGVP